MPYRRHPTDHRAEEAAWQWQKLTYDEWIDAATKDASWIVHWQRRNNLSDGDAAEELGLSVSAYRKQRAGKRKVSKQTAKLAIKYPFNVQLMFDIAQIALTVTQRHISGR